MPTLATPLLRLAVLPARDTAEEDGYFSRGFIDDLITDLSRFSSLGLISTHSSFASRYRDMSDANVAADLEADLFLKTTVRKRGPEVRINAQLVEPQSGNILWAERYDAPENEIFSLQDSLVEKIVAALSLRIDAVTLEAARRKPLTELEAYDCWLRGYDKLQEGSPEANEAARELFERALEIDPHYARAYVGLSLSHFNEWSCQNWNMSELSECRSFQYATQALQLDRSDHVAHLVTGRVHLFRSEFAKAREHMELAYELNPNDADQLVHIASCKAFLGELDKSHELFQRALTLNPHCEPWYYAYGGFIEIMRKNYEEGIEIALKAPLTSVWIDLPGFIALAHAYLGNNEEAAVYRKIFLGAFQEKVTEGRPPAPGEAMAWLLTVNPFQRGEDASFYRNGLLKAGLSEPQATEDKPASATPDRTAAVFQLENKLRTMAFEGTRVQLPEVKGFKDIARLLNQGQSEIHCTELMGSVSENAEATEVMDAQARAEYAARIRELQSELAECEDHNDLARAEKVRSELDPLIDHLSKSMGIGGKSRKLAAPAERARSAVTLRIRSAIRKIEAAHPVLAKHFSNSIRTGTFCSYEPEKPVGWKC